MTDNNKTKCLSIVSLLISIAILLTGCGPQQPAVVKKGSIAVPPAGNSAVSEERITEIISGTGLDAMTGGSTKKSVTVMVYMNGSDLESNIGAATADISEMLDSNVGENVNVVVQTMGTKTWQNDVISPDTAQTYLIKNGNLVLLRDNLGQLDCTSEFTLSEFINYCKTNYPADRNIFLFWDHGGGPVFGFGYDEWQTSSASLTLSEMARGFAANQDVYFDMIGMDCCIMASLETCYALAPYCKYTLLSEDFESGLGWSYKEWLDALEENPSITTPILGKRIIDTMITSNETEVGGDSACVSLFNESTAENLFKAWKAYAYKNDSAFFEKKYSKLHKAKGRGSFRERYSEGDVIESPDFDVDYDYDPDFDYSMWDEDISYVTLSDYYITDMMALIESVDNESEEAKNLISALKAAVAYNGHTSDKNELTGMSVSLPYGDAELYEQIKYVYQGTLDSDYIEWLSNFTIIKDDEYSFEDFENEWDGWGAYEHEYGASFSGDQTGDHAYEYETGNFYGHEDSFLSENWVYDYEDDIWYLYDGDLLYLYDDESNTFSFFDTESRALYVYNEATDDWELEGYY